MPETMVARVTCPNCSNQFQTPVEQILDVRADPNAKARVLNGLVNAAICPHCKMGGALGLPFLYHDPEKELALILMPMEAGRDNLERQQAIGRLTSAVIDTLPPEERKGYLLQPEVFLTLDNIVNKILEADGVTPEMIEAQKAKAELLRQMIEAPSEEALEAMIKENDENIDADIFAMLNLNVQMAQASGQVDDVQRLADLHKKLLGLSTEGQVVKAHVEAVEALREEPTREKLLGLLVQTAEERTRELLIASGRPLLDYAFFQSLTARIEAASAKDEKARLTALRSEVLDIRDRIDEETQALFEERAALLRDLLLSDDPETMARQRFDELDRAFLSVLATNLDEAEAAGDAGAIEPLRAIWNLVFRLMEETLPPEIRLLNQLMRAKDEADVENLLQENRALVTENLVQLLEGAESDAQEGDAPEGAAERLALVLKKAKAMVTNGDSA